MQDASTASSDTPSTDKAAVSIEHFSFSPETLTVKSGTTVIWTNNETASHNIKSNVFSSPMLEKGQTFEYKFDKAGTYEYTCGVHPNMKGSINIE